MICFGYNLSSVIIYMELYFWIFLMCLMSRICLLSLGSVLICLGLVLVYVSLEFLVRFLGIFIFNYAPPTRRRLDLW